MQTSDATSSFPPVFAEVILRSASGGSALETPPTATTLSRLKPDEATIRRAREVLEGLGMGIAIEGPISLTISAPREAFELAFKTRLELHAAGIAQTYRLRSPIVIPDALVPYAEAVVLPHPAEFHS